MRRWLDDPGRLPTSIELAISDAFPVETEDANVDVLAVLIAIAVVLDFVTTTIIFLDQSLVEGNEFLAALASVHVTLALAFNLGYGALLAGTYVFVRGWLGRVAAAMAVPSAVIGVNNAVYALEGAPSPISVAFGPSLHLVLAYGIPLFGLAAGTVWHVARTGRLPWRRVTGTVTAMVASFGIGAIVV